MLSSKAVIAISFMALVACRPVSAARPDSTSEAQGIIGKSLTQDFLPPPLRSSEALSRLSKALLGKNIEYLPLKSKEGKFRRHLYAAVLSEGGISRSQIHAVLERIVAPQNQACGGASCAQVLGFGQQDIDRLLDEALAAVRRSARLQKPDMSEKRSLLIRSLEKIPSWLTLSDFGDPLIPRKAYDLSAEIATFKSCAICRISSDTKTIRDMISGARLGDHFVWALRPDGRLVVGRGPDEMMSHGVLASIDLVDKSKTGKTTLSVLASGEGYIDPVNKTLVLNNKSGHYRPPFTRVKNPSIARIFSNLAPDFAKGVTFVDKTKTP